MEVKETNVVHTKQKSSKNNTILGKDRKMLKKNDFLIATRRKREEENTESWTVKQATGKIKTRICRKEKAKSNTHTHTHSHTVREYKLWKASY